MDLSTMQGLMVVVGPIVLALVLAYAVLRNRSARTGIDETERATRERYDRQDREDRARDSGTPTPPPDRTRG